MADTTVELILNYSNIVSCLKNQALVVNKKFTLEALVLFMCLALDLFSKEY